MKTIDEMSLCELLFRLDGLIQLRDEDSTDLMHNELEIMAISERLVEIETSTT